MQILDVLCGHHHLLLAVTLYSRIHLQFWASTFGTYWAIQESFPLTILTYGVIGGIPHALLYPAAINIAVRWVPDKIGFIAGLILTGYGCGSFSWNQLTTWFINPDNLQPELHVGEDVCAYGQTFITDDHFLTLVASFSSIFNALGRPFWGLIGDRVGYRIVALLCQCMAAALVATFVTTEDTGRAAFFIWVCAMFLSMCGFFTMKAALMLALFGSKYFNSNLGLLITNGVFGAILTGIIAPVLKDAFGWHGMFYFGFGGIFVESGVGVKL
nr:hypothetical protein BaRGS_022654 [Batillaria attramentaria]